MMLGSIASQYYLKRTTISMFGSNLGPDISLEVSLHIFSGASEYDELPMQHNEEKHNEELSERVLLTVDKNRFDDPHVKANLLFQAHFSRLHLPISDYNTDLKSVLDQSIRIIQAMIDVCANSGWLSSALTCMHLLQLVMQGLWFQRDSSLRMLPCMTDDLISSLSRRGILKVPQLLDVQFATLEALTDNSAVSRLQQSSNNYSSSPDLQHFPRIGVQLKVQRKDSDSGKGLSLNIRLENLNSDRRTSRAIAPRFPKVKDEAWWLVLGSSSTSELYALKRVSFSERLLTHLNIQSTANLQEMKLFLVSDCYLGFEQEYNIEEFA